jgi:tetratricopeptide (TPR) repeat protein
LTLDASGQIKPLDRPGWLERHERLGQLGGAPATTQADRHDPVLFGPDPTARARCWIRRGRWRMAEVAFGAALVARPADTSIRLDRARFYRDRSEDEKANEDVALVLDRTPGSRQWGSPLNAFLMSWLDSPRIFDGLANLRPEDARLWSARARRHALRDEWPQAVDDFSHAIDSAPPDTEEWFEYAALRLIVGDTPGYEAFLRQARSRVEDNSDPFVDYVLARMCTLSARTAIEPGQVIRWAEAAVTRDRGAATLYTLGMAHFRSGHFEEAIRWFTEPGVETWGGLGTMQIQLGLAMTHHRRGDVAKARTLLNEVERSWSVIDRDRTDGAVKAYVIDWLAYQPLWKEARALIGSQSKGTQPPSRSIQ